MKFNLYHRGKCDEKIKHEKELSKEELLAKLSDLMDNNPVIKIKITRGG